jgi:nitroreductase
MDVFEAIGSRRSIARLAPEAPPRAVVERLLSAATWAPFHHCAEPWRFIVIEGSARASLGEIAAESLSVPANLPQDALRKLVRKEQERFLRAPVIVTVVALGAGDPVDAEENYAACCAATQNLLLAAQAQGLSGYWRTGKIVRDPRICGALGVAEGERIVAMVYLGTPVEGAAVAATRTPWYEKTTWLDGRAATAAAEPVAAAEARHIVPTAG